VDDAKIQRVAKSIRGVDPNDVIQLINGSDQACDLIDSLRPYGIHANGSRPKLNKTPPSGAALPTKPNQRQSGSEVNNQPQTQRHPTDPLLTLTPDNWAHASKTDAEA
jgi:hypothetical protein